MDAGKENVMNLIRQRERLKAIHKAGLLHTEFLHLALNSPVFEWDLSGRESFTPEQKNFINEFIATGDSAVPTVSPYHCFRLSMKDGFMQWFFAPDKDQWFVIKLDDDHHISGHELWTLNLYQVKAGGNNEYRLFCDGKDVSRKLIDADGRINQWAKEAMRSMVSWLSLFLCDLDMPGNVVLKVSPESKGKSVEWRLAREHYLIINKKQAAMCRDNKRGPSEAQIQRSAHSRIAHFRVLRSEKFTHKRGQRIRVREAWVGPEEWVGLDKKIYKVCLKPS
jgi:hypothetical protein